jgi:capsid protein
VTFAQLSHALYTAPVMPWIDPVKEVTGLQMQDDRCYTSGAEIVRRRGRNPADVIRAQAKWQKDLKTAGVVTQDAPTAQPPYKKQPPPADTTPEAFVPNTSTTTAAIAAAGKPAVATASAVDSPNEAHSHA